MPTILSKSDEQLFSRAKGWLMRNLSDPTRRLAQDQLGLLTIRQLAADGFRARRVNQLIAQGHWARVSPVVVATHSQPLTRLPKLWAAALHFQHCGLAGPSVLELVGMPTPHDGRIHIVGTRAGRLPPLPGCIQHTSIALKIASTHPPRVGFELAVIQALAWAATDRQSVFFATWAIQRGLVTLDGLHELNDPLLKSRLGKLAHTRLAMIKPGVHSVNEFDFAAECAARGLPEPVRQRQRRDVAGRNRYTDVEFDLGARKLVVEIDGLGHLDTRTRVDDQLRANELNLQGDIVIRVPAVELRTNPDPFLDQIARALQP